MRIGRIAISLLVWLAVAQAAFAADEPVARIDGAELSAADIRGILQAMDPAARARIVHDRKALAALVRAELGRRVVLDAARQAKFDQRPEIQTQLARARDELVMNLYINSVAAAPADYPSEAEIKQAYDGNLTKFMKPRQYHLAKIFIATKADPAAAKAKADEIAKKARAAGADFAALAKANSDDPETAAKGGDIGWAVDGSLIPDLAGPVKSMTEHEIIGPVAINGGWAILTELGTRPAGPQPLDEVRPTLIAYLRQQRGIAEAESYIDGLLKQHNAAVNEIALDKLLEK